MKTIWLTTTQAAKIHKMNRQLFLYYVNTGRGPDGERRGKYWFFPKVEVTEWEKPEALKPGPKT